jgi:hypothetical protein
MFWLEKLKRRDISEDLGVDGKIILEWNLTEMGWKIVDWMHLAKERGQWENIVNTVMNFRVL